MKKYCKRLTQLAQIIIIMSELSPTTMEQRIMNEMTPPNRIKPLERNYRKISVLLCDSVTLNSPQNLMNKFDTIHFDETKESINIESLNEEDKENKQININMNFPEKIEFMKKNEIFGDSMSSNCCSYDSNSSNNNSSILHSSLDDQPDTSTPQHSTIPNSQKYKMYRPPDLVIEESIDENKPNDFMSLSQYSPVRSPFLSDTANDSLFADEDTPQPINHKSPPKGSLLCERDRKMVQLLKRFGLSHLAFIFIEQEIDVGLFLTLNDEDLQEIGIKRNTDRNVILSVISDCNDRIRRLKNDNQ